MAEFPKRLDHAVHRFDGQRAGPARPVPRLQGHHVNFSGEGAVAKPERPFAEESEEFNIVKTGDAGIPQHHKNWLEAIRGGKLNNCPVELGAKIQSILAMAEMSSRTSRMIQFDPATRAIKPG